MKKCIFIVTAAIMVAACVNKRADEISKVVESSRMTECNISVGGLHFTKSLNGAEQQVSDSQALSFFVPTPMPTISVTLTKGKCRKMTPPYS